MVSLDVVMTSEDSDEETVDSDKVRRRCHGTAGAVLGFEVESLALHGPGARKRDGPEGLSLLQTIQDRINYGGTMYGSSSVQGELAAFQQVIVPFGMKHPFPLWPRSGRAAA